MSGIHLERVNVHYPLLEDHYKSFRRAALRFVTGGRVYAEDGQSRVIHALKDVSIDIRDGDRVALVGRNGAGKSTLLKTIGGFILPDGGVFHVDGKVTSLFTVNGGMDIERTGYDNIYLVGRLYGIPHRQMKKYVADIEDFSELDKFLDMPLRSYSDGMKLRLGIAVVTCVHPDILVLDEALGAGDAHFIEKTTQRVHQFYERARIMIMASHDPSILKRLCNRGVWLDKGVVVKTGGIDEVLDAYMTSG